MATEPVKNVQELLREKWPEALESLSQALALAHVQSTTSPTGESVSLRPFEEVVARMQAVESSIAGAGSPRRGGFVVRGSSMRRRGGP